MLVRHTLMLSHESEWNWMLIFFISMTYLALAMYDTYASTLPSPTIASLTSTESTPLSKPSQFIYISAEDIFRPFIPSRYISTKREAERILLSKDLENSLDPTKRQIKTTVIRPSMSFHALVPVPSPYFLKLTNLDFLSQV